MLRPLWRLAAPLSAGEHKAVAHWIAAEISDAVVAIKKPISIPTFGNTRNSVATQARTVDKANLTVVVAQDPPYHAAILSAQAPGVVHRGTGIRNHLSSNKSSVLCSNKTVVDLTLHLTSVGRKCLLVGHQWIVSIHNHSGTPHNG
jgi:hypothetical protein